jgi:drug/metabolite transporter (DMT)-like permease
VSNHVLSIIIAFLAYSMLDLGKAFQKIGLAAMSRNRARGITIWLGASTATSASSLLILYAVSLGSVLIVGSMAGTGLAAVTLLTVLLMKEPVRLREIVGVASVMTAPFLLASAKQEPSATRVVIEHLFYFSGAVVAVLAFLLLFLRKRAKLLGMLLAGGAGALGGLVILFQKVSTSSLGRATSFLHLHSAVSAAGGGLLKTPLPLRLLHALANPYTAAWIALSLLSTLVLQLSYQHGQAIRLIPSFNSAYILIPIIGGALIFREPLHPVQWVGILFILCGVSVLMFGKARRKGTARAAPSRNATRLN